MRFHYLLYPDAKEKLETNGLLKKIQEVKDSEEGLPFIGATFDHDVVDAIKEMQEQGYFKNIPNDLKKQFMSNLNKAFQDKENNPWKVERVGKIIQENPEPEDFYLMTGWLSSFVLDKNEIWDYKKYGFENLNDFVGSIGVAIWSANKIDFREGYCWTTKTKENRMIENRITGDSNLDLRVYQIDKTPDKTYDPTGEVVSYRPELDDDSKCVAAYHSTEQDFLVGVLKWIDQQKIPNILLNYNGINLGNYTRSLGRTIGPATECFDDFSGIDGPRIKLSSFFDNIPVLDKDFSTNEPTFDGVWVDGECFYGMFVGPNKELIFSYQGKGERKPKKTISACFLPEDADHLLKGICYQAAKGLGRTSPNKLISLIDYRFSGRLEKDIEDIRKRNQDYLSK